MQEFFYEESSKTSDEKSSKLKYNIGKVFSIISYVLAIIWIFLAINFFNITNWFSIVLIILPFALFIASGIVLVKVKDRFYVDYDYTLVTGSIRFSKVINNVKRKSIIEFSCSDIIKIGKYGSDSYAKIVIMPDIKKQILTSNSYAEKGKEFYYIYLAKDGERRLFILESTEELIKNIIRFSNRTVISSEDFK